MIDDEHTTDAHLGGRNIFTAGDWQRAMQEAYRIDDLEAARILLEHGIWASHCGGYDVAAWPCPTAAKVMHALLSRGGASYPGGAA